MAAQSAGRKVKFSNPFMVREVTILTTPAQLVYQTSFDDCAASMRNLSSALPTLVKNPSEMMSVNGAVDQLIKNALAELRKEAARIKKIAEDNGIEIGKMNYTNAARLQAKLTCGKAGQYLQIISELDELICLVHSAWFAGFVADDAKSSLERQWRRKMIGVAAEIKNITNRAFKANAKQTGTEELQPGGEAVTPTAANAKQPPKPKRAKTKTTAMPEVAEAAAA